jgi:hypothetical protein
MRDSVIHKDRQVVTESIELFTEDPASSRLYDLASCQPLSPLYRQQLVSLNLPVCRARSRIIRPRESLALYKSFNTFCVELPPNITRFSYEFGKTYGVIKGSKVLEGLT